MTVDNGSAPTALVVFASMYGNTHVIADHVADGLRSVFATEVMPAVQVTPAHISGADLVVFGAPTHVHSLPGPRSREAAVAAVEKSPDELTLDPEAPGPG